MTTNEIPDAIPLSQKMPYAVSWRAAAEQPEGIGGRLRSAVRRLTLDALSLLPNRPAQQFLRCLTCHYVFDDQKEQFAQLINALSQTGTFVDTQSCVEMFRGLRPIDGPYFHLSFDDGLRNVVKNAFPVLSRKRIPAAFFIPTSLIDGDPDAVRHYCLQTTKYRAVIEMASWDDLRHADPELFEIGSHTQNHVRASQVSAEPELLKRELIQSKAEIERQLGRPCRYLAWPYGQSSDVNQLATQLAAAAGYDAAFGVERGSIVPGHSAPFCLPRHHFEVQWPRAHVLYFARGNMERPQERWNAHG